jgi:hypothetical protein
MIFTQMQIKFRFRVFFEDRQKQRNGKHVKVSSNWLTFLISSFHWYKTEGNIRLTRKKGIYFGFICINSQVRVYNFYFLIQIIQSCSHKFTVSCYEAWKLLSHRKANKFSSLPDYTRSKDRISTGNWLLLHGWSSMVKPWGRFFAVHNRITQLGPW